MTKEVYFCWLAQQEAKSGGSNTSIVARKSKLASVTFRTFRWPKRESYELKPAEL
jgi:hypothetical protein